LLTVTRFRGNADLVVTRSETSPKVETSAEKLRQDLQMLPT
jgi:hypothetical protein